MNREKILGAIAFPTFMLTWALGAMLALVQLHPVDAAERWLPVWDSPVTDDFRADAHAVAAVPRLDDPASMRQFAQALVETSEVMSGRWQPPESQPEPKAAKETRSMPASAQPQPRVSVAAEVPPAGTPVRSVASAASVSGNAAVAENASGSENASVSENAYDSVNRSPAVDTVVAVRAVDRARVPSTRTGGDPTVRKRPSTGTAPGLSREKVEARRALESGRFAEAYARLRPSVGEARGDVEYLGLLALAAMRTGSPGEAVVIYQHLTAMEPDASRWWVGYALAQESLGLDASGVYREALDLSAAGTEVRALLESKLAGGGPEGFS